jgi:fumarate reductase flavoprotein subunit
VDDSAARWADDIIRKSGGVVDRTIVDAVTVRSADAIHFLVDRVGLDLHLALGLTIPGHSAPRLHATPGESGRELAALLVTAISHKTGITFLPDTEALGLVLEGDRVIGAQTRQGGPIHGRHTLLASGGFASNAEMIARHAPEILGAVNIGCGPNDGRAMLWGEALGGALTLMDSYQGQGHTTVDGLGRLGPGLTSFGAIVVNALGQRFANDAMGPSEFGAFVLAQPGGSAVEIFDQRIHDAALRLSSYRETVDRGNVLSGATLAELAAQFGLPAPALQATLDTYHASVAGAPDPFGRQAGLHRLEPPFMGARVTGALAHTQGGLRVDAATRVLRADGSSVPGLLAAGGAAASISGPGAAGYLPGNGLGQAFALGLIAGETIASGRA